VMDDATMLAYRLHALADNDDPGAPPTDLLLRRGRRSRAARTTTLATAGVAAVALGAVAAATLPSTGPAAQRSAASPPPPTPAPLTLAAQHTAAASFRFDMRVTTVGTSSTAGLTGAYDPVNRRGYLKTVGKARVKLAEQRRIGDRCYVLPAPGSRWVSTQCGPGDSLGTSAGLTTDPAGVLAQLKANGSATYVGRTGSGATAVDTWQFTYTVPTGKASVGFTETGTATVDVATNQVATVAFRFTPDRPKSTVEEITYRYSGYGERVEVTAP
jgi:hypothetical protein